LDTPKPRKGATAKAAKKAAGQTKEDATQSLDISVVTPIYNEVESIPLLVERLFHELRKLGRPFEVIAVNDGSTDGSDMILDKLALTHPELRPLHFARNFGQTAAMMAGFDHARGDIIVTIDADLQNDPADIATVVARIDEGYDLCSGWRRDRKDAAVKRNFVSRVANRLISRVSGVELHDYGCTLKAYRRSVIDGMKLYGEMHRFIPIVASGMGARIVEVPVGHQARAFGQSKYGLERIVKVTLDLLLMRFMHKHMARPIHLFGSFGLFFLLISGLSFLAMIYAKVFHDVPMIMTPLPLFSGMFFVLGIITMLMGLIAEILMRTYFESQQRPHYLLRRAGPMPDGLA
jgi:glycosyltransferase involved in cell wall biosynthesis